MIKKILIYGLLAFLVYKGSSYYFFYTSAKKLQSCPTVNRVMQVKDNAVKTRDDLLASTKAYRCLKLKQNFAEAYFFKIPDSWLNPSIEYVNPPFTEEELNPEAAFVDEAMKRDLLALRNIFSDDVIKEITTEIPDIKTASLDEIDRFYLRKTEALKELVAKLRALRPDSIKLATLETQLAYTLSMLGQNISEGMKLYKYAYKKMAEGDALLAKPKDQLKFHREELMRLKSEMSNLEAQFNGLSSKEKALENDLRKTAREVDELVRTHT